MTDIPPPPNYPPSVGLPVTYWAASEPEPVTEEQPGFDWASLHLAYNASALAAGVLISPFWLKVLHIFGDQYAAAIAFVALAAWLDHRRQHWLTRALVYAVAIAGLLDQTSIAELVYYLTGVQL